MKIKELNRKLTKLAESNGFFMIPKDDMIEIYKTIDYIISENKRLMKRNKELRSKK